MVGFFWPPFFKAAQGTLNKTHRQRKESFAERVESLNLQLFPSGCGSKLNRRGYAGLATHFGKFRFFGCRSNLSRSPEASTAGRAFRDLEEVAGMRVPVKEANVQELGQEHLLANGDQLLDLLTGAKRCGFLFGATKKDGVASKKTHPCALIYILPELRSPKVSLFKGRLGDQLRNGSFQPLASEGLILGLSKPPPMAPHCKGPCRRVCHFFT